MLREDLSSKATKVHVYYPEDVWHLACKKVPGCC
jgi:hypothetical protein